ncbi:MAG: hypothetical protein Q8P63_00465, partial [Candidatus Nealsonbacteria bacterium]|nr:hypothetical protein [Candidatus Nealsonbacteria bacterium]
MAKQVSSKLVALTFGVLVISLAIVFYAVAWTEPSQSPPGGNVFAPLNIGPTGQSKEGGLILNTGGAAVGLIVGNGSVGIGITEPGYKLDIQGGQVNASGGLCVAGDCKPSWGGTLSNMVVFTANGTYITPADVTKIRVRMVGGGGGGGGQYVNAGGGGGGSTAGYGYGGISSGCDINIKGGAGGYAGYASSGSGYSYGGNGGSSILGGGGKGGSAPPYLCPPPGSGGTGGNYGGGGGGSYPSGFCRG